MRKICDVLGTVALAAVVVAATVSFVGCRKQNQNDDAQETVKIACNLPMTGELAYFGERIQNGVRLALKEQDGKHVRFDFQDNRGEAKNAVTILQKQLSKDVDVYVSGVAGATMALLGNEQLKDKPHFIWSFYPLFLSKNGNIFRTWLNFGIEAQNYIDICKNANPKTVSYVYVNIEACAEQAKFVKEHLNKIDPSISVHLEPYDMNEKNFRNIAAKKAILDSDILIINGYKNHLISLIKELNYNNIDKTKIIASFDLLDAAPHLDKSQVEDIRLLVPKFLIDKYASPRYKKWKQNYQEMFNVTPDYTDAYAYEMATILIEAAKIAEVQKTNIHDALRIVDIEGITGRLKFDEYGDLLYDMETCSYKNGELIPFISK